MTREEIAQKIYVNTGYSSGTSLVVMTQLEEMGLIKFESEREAVIKDAEKYISTHGPGYSSTVVARLLALLK